MHKILFLTGTRADYGKIKPLMQKVEAMEDCELYVFVCGMHLSEKFGSTYHEVLKDGYKNVYVAYGLNQTANMSVNTGNTICCLAGYVENIKPDMIVVHGDRMDALAGAVVGVMCNSLVAHIEGGELSGTMDESIRHAISKLAHVHFVCSEEAKDRLIQLGEEKERIYIIGSPDIDVMMSKNLPSISDVKKRYDINFDKFGILMYHPVTTEYSVIGSKAKSIVDGVINSNKNFVVVYPNNDLGSEVILNEFKRFEGNPRFAVFPSLRFEYFLTLLKNSEFIIGNSSAGIRESGVYGIPAVDIGTRQSGRYSTEKSKNILHTSENAEEITYALSHLPDKQAPEFLFGEGDSAKLFTDIIGNDDFWRTKIQKRFIDYE